MDIIYLIIGILIGGASIWFIARIKYKSQKGFSVEKSVEIQNEINTLITDKKVLEEKLSGYVDNLEELKYNLQTKESSIIELSSRLSAKSSDYSNLLNKLDTQKEELSNLQDKFSVEFKNLANEILEEKTKKFTEQNKTNLTEILNPLNNRIKEFEKKVEDTYDKESKQRFSLKEEVKRLAELNQQISKEANNLTNALKGESKTQGNWGEIILENILEKSGLVKDREYFVQTSYTDNLGKRFQPDIVIHYPGDRNVVIDSKVSLTAYERYATSENKVEQETAYKEHIISIKNHINELSAKNYHEIYQIKSLDFVMMFLPVEPAYLVAIQGEPNLWNYAYEKRVLLISPTNLIAALKMVSSLWQQEYQNQNAMEIAKKSGDLYDKFVGLVEDLQDVGKRLDATRLSYDSSMNKLSTGKGNLIKRAEDIKKLGAKTKKTISQQLLDNNTD